MARFLSRGAYDVLVRGERRRQGYKYVVRAPWTIELGHDYGHFACHHQRYDMPPRPEPFFELKGNILIVHPGYHWDGCSGPTWDTAGNMGPGLVHDCLYQAIRLRFIPELAPEDRTWAEWRKYADDDFRDLLESQGWGTSDHKTRIGRFFERIGGGIRKAYYHKAVRWFGKSSARPRVPEGWTVQVPDSR